MNSLLIGNNKEYSQILSPIVEISWSKLENLKTLNKEEYEEYEWLHSISLHILSILESNQTIDSIIILLSIEEESLELIIDLILHLRLTRSQNHNTIKNLDSFPIVVLSQLSKEEIINFSSHQNNTKYLCLFFDEQELIFVFDEKCSKKDTFCNKLYFKYNKTSRRQLELERIKNEIELASSFFMGLSIDSFTNKLKLPNKAGTTNHNVTNQWGAYKLGVLVGMRINNNLTYSPPNHLYIKYLIAKNNIALSNPASLNIINAQGKNILVIDDEHDKGWESLYRFILKGANIVVVQNEGNIQEFLKTAKEEAEKDWDLILLDLRLSPEDHDSYKTFDELSGSEILALIKKKNQGTQVIITTASNKAWNLNGLLIEGVERNDGNYTANGYYVKESPLFSFNNIESLQNYDSFKQNIENSFKKEYLRRIFVKIKKFKEYIETSDNRTDTEYSNLVNKSLVALTSVYDILSKNDPRIYSAYIILFNIVEDFVNLYFDTSSAGSDIWIVRGNPSMVIKNSPIHTTNPRTGQPIVQHEYHIKHIRNPPDMLTCIDGSTCPWQYFEKNTEISNSASKDLLVKFSGVFLLKCTKITHVATREQYTKDFYKLKKQYRDKLSHSNHHIWGVMKVENCEEIMNIAYMLFTDGELL